MELSFKDFVFSLGTIAGVVSLVRTIVRDKVEPRRQELLAILTTFETDCAAVSTEILLYLTGSKSARDYGHILRLDSAARRSLDAARRRLNDAEFAPLSSAHADWWRVMCEAPFAATRPRRPLSTHCAEIKGRDAAQANLSLAVDRLRNRILNGKACALKNLRTV